MSDKEPNEIAIITSIANTQVYNEKLDTYLIP